MTGKPKLLFFQWDHRGIPEFAQLHMRLHVRCLAEFFDVTVIDRDCDYLEICERFEPDLSLFEAGVNYPGSRRPTIRNATGNSSVPKVGLHNGDAWCEARAGFVSDMDRWGIETFFTISTTTAEHSPELADRMYVWPNFVDGELYRDYGAAKIIPVLITGKIDSLYPWRQHVTRMLTKHFATFVLPHQGYSIDVASRTIYGEQYARAINASFFVPTCGTVAHEFLRKHLEIPAAGACLVTDKSEALISAGFESMTNCVFADAGDILDKLDYLLRNREKLAAITAAGNALVHSRHTMKQRDQIGQWYTLTKRCAPADRIVQPDPFAPLMRVGRESARPAVHIRGQGAHLEALSRGDEALSLGRLDDAEMHYRCCLNYSPAMPEPRLRLARYYLARGDAAMALQWLKRPIEYTLDTYGAVDPDPVEWAYLIISTLCAGEAKRAEELASRFAYLQHTELDRARWVIEVISGGKRRIESTIGNAFEGGHRRQSIHNLTERHFGAWVDDVTQALSACGQAKHAQTVRRASAFARLHLGDRIASTWSNEPSRLESNPPLLVDQARLRKSPFPRQSRVSRGWSKLSDIMRVPATQVLARLKELERRFGYFLPYRYSAMRLHPFVRATQAIIWEKDVTTVFVLGARFGKPVTEAVLSAQFRGANVIHLYNAGTAACRSLRQRWRGDIRAEFEETANDARPVDTDDQFTGAEVALAIMEAPEAASTQALELFANADFAVLGRINHAAGFENYQRLLSGNTHRLLEHDPTGRNGYAVFERLESTAIRRNLQPRGRVGSLSTGRHPEAALMLRNMTARCAQAPSKRYITWISLFNLAPAVGA